MCVFGHDPHKAPQPTTTKPSNRHSLLLYNAAYGPLAPTDLLRRAGENLTRSHPLLPLRPLLPHQPTKPLGTTTPRPQPHHHPSQPLPQTHPRPTIPPLPHPTSLIPHAIHPSRPPLLHHPIHKSPTHYAYARRLVTSRTTS
jgi:hypothetical protein